MKKILILMMILSSTILFTGCESKTDKLENKLNELESTVQDMSTSTTTTEVLNTSSAKTTTSTSTRKKVIKQTQTTTTTVIYTTTKSTRKIPIAKYPDEDENDPGRMVTGYKICDSSNKCTCYYEGESPYSCE